jgi:hypothetical protein
MLDGMLFFATKVLHVLLLAGIRCGLGWLCTEAQQHQSAALHP